jgi:hypothetical protein
MKKVFALIILTSLISCSPYQRMFLSSANRSTFVEDSCDVTVLRQLKQVTDTNEDWWKVQDPATLLGDVETDPACEYYSKKFLAPLHKDSTIWVMTIRPVQVGKKEIILGNLYTLKPNQDSGFVFLRRVKEYSQYENFERGKYVVFTYYLEDDSTSVVKLGSRIY